MTFIKTETISVAEIIFRAAVPLAGPDLNGSFSIHDLAIRAWESNKKRLGWGPYWETHLDSKRISCEIMGRSDGENSKRCLKWMERVAASTYRLTAAGIAKARGLSQEIPQRKSPCPKCVVSLSGNAQWALELLRDRFADNPAALASIESLKPLIIAGSIPVNCCFKRHGGTWDGISTLANCGLCRVEWVWLDGKFCAEKV